MKKNLLVIACAAMLVACGGNTASEKDNSYSTNSNEEATAAADERASAGDEAATADFEQGKKLIASSDCLSCHQEKQKLVGPAYEEVARKYELNAKNTAYLADKIIKGGSGVWGQIPMSPHPDLKEADAQEMARYVLSLRP